jgi:hypothetical protein
MFLLTDIDIRAFIKKLSKNQIYIRLFLYHFHLTPHHFNNCDIFLELLLTHLLNKCIN